MVCTKHLSRLSGSAELGIRFSRRPAGRNQPLGALETRPFPPTVLLKSGAQPARVVSLSPGSGEGQSQANTFRHRDGVGAQAGVESSARDEGKRPKCTDGVQAPSETGRTEKQAEPE